MDMVSLKATARPSDRTARSVRTEGKVPCVVYGNDVPNTSISCVYNEIFKAYVKAGESTLVELDLDGKKLPVLIHAVQFEPVSDRLSHVDFYAVNMKKEIEAHVPVHFEGESPAVKDMAGILVTVMDHVTVRCLPADLPHALTVSIDGLATFHDTVSVSAIALPKGVKIMEEGDAVLVTVQEPRKEEEIAPATPVAAEGEAAAPVVEGAATAEGAAPAPEAKK